MLYCQTYGRSKAVSQAGRGKEAEGAGEEGGALEMGAAAGNGSQSKS